MACASVILLVSDAIVALVGLAMAAKAQPEQKKAVPMKAGGEKPKTATPQSTEKAEDKKEL